MGKAMKGARPVQGAAVFACPCSRTFGTRDQRDQHMLRSACKVYFDGHAAEEVTSSSKVTDDRRAAERQDAENCKRVRSEFNAGEMRRTMARRLANLRYVKLVPSAHIKEVKNMHTEANRAAMEKAAAEISILLSPLVPAAIIQQVISIVEAQFDIYKGIRTETSELNTLKQSVSIPEVLERPLKGTTGSYAYDFKLDEFLLLLMQHCPRARRDIYDTLKSWRTRSTHTLDDPARIIADITDGAVFLKHPIFGEHTRVSPEEAERTAPQAPLRFAILLYGDGYTVSTGTLLCVTRSLVATRATSHVAMRNACVCVRVA